MHLEVNRKVVSFASLSLGVISRSMHAYTLLTKTFELLCFDEIRLWSWVSGVLLACLFSSQVNYSAARSGYILCSLVHVTRHMTHEETGKWECTEVSNNKIHVKNSFRWAGHGFVCYDNENTEGTRGVRQLIWRKAVHVCRLLAIRGYHKCRFCALAQNCERDCLLLCGFIISYFLYICFSFLFFFCFFFFPLVYIPFNLPSQPTFTVSAAFMPDYCCH